MSNALAHNPLYRAKQDGNYLGMRGMTGAAMLEAMHQEAEEAGAVFMEGRVLSILPMGEDFMTAVGNEMVESRRVILCTGIAARPYARPGGPFCRPRRELLCDL